TELIAPPLQEHAHDVRQGWELACRCADTELARHKHLRELFYAIADDPDLGARDLARKVGLLAEGTTDPKEVRRAEQHVWKLRERILAKLADYFEALERR